MHINPSHPQDDDPPPPLNADARELFALALELEPEARDALLDEVRRRDPESAEEIRSLVDAWFLEPAFLDQAGLDGDLLALEDRDRDDRVRDEPDLDDRDRENRDSPIATASAEVCSPLDLQRLLRHWSRYRLDHRLGHGSTSLVYRATDRDSGAEVAIKFLVHLGETELARFEREAATLRKIEHPAVLPLLDSGTVEGVPFLVTRLVEGPRLLDLRSRATLRQKVEILLAIARGLEAAHRQQVVHRDIKPSNILLEPTQDGWRAYLADFGIARDPESRSLTATGMLVGTPAYLAPERLRGTAQPLDPRGDLYSLGVTFYELLVGQRPYPTDDTLEILRRIQRGDLRPPRQARPDLPETLEAILLSCLAHDPEERYPSSGALITDLERFLAGESVSPRRRGWRHRGLATVAVGALVVTLALGGLATRSGIAGSSPEPDSEPPSRAATPQTLTSRDLTPQNQTSQDLMPRRPTSRPLTLPALTPPTSPALALPPLMLSTAPSPTGPALDLHEQGREQLRRLDFAKAKAFFETALEDHPDRPLLHADLSRAWLGLGFDLEAQRHAERAVALASGLPVPLQRRLEGQLHRTHGRWDEATELLMQVWHQEPGDLEVGLELADAWLGSGLGKPVLEILRRVETTPPQDWDDPRLALIEARAALALGDLDHSARAIEWARHGAERVGAPLIVARSLLVETTLQSRRQAPGAALEAATQAKILFVQAGDTAGAADAMLVIARLLGDQSRAREALQANQEAMVFYREVGHESGRASALNQIAITGYAIDQDFPTARRHFEEALEIYRALDDRPGVANSLGNLALLFSLQERFAPASDYFEQALGEYRALGQNVGIARTLSNLALSLQNQGQTGEAILALEESLEIRELTGDLQGQALTHLNLGHLHRLKADLSRAQDHYRGSLVASRELEWEVGQARALQGLGRVAHLRQDWETAQGYLNESLARYAASSPDRDAYTRIALAKLWFDQGQPRRATEVLKNVPTGNVAAWAHALLARAFGALGDSVELREHLDAARELRRKDQGFSDLEVGIELALAEHELGAPAGSDAWRAAVETPLEKILQQALDDELVTVACAARLALVTIRSSLEGSHRAELEAIVDLATAHELQLYRDKALRVLRP